MKSLYGYHRKENIIQNNMDFLKPTLKLVFLTVLKSEVHFSFSRKKKHLKIEYIPTSPLILN